MTNKPIINGDGKLTVNHPVVVIALLWMVLQGFGTVFGFVTEMNREGGKHVSASDNVTRRDLLDAINRHEMKMIEITIKQTAILEKQTDILIRLESEMRSKNR